MLIDTDVNKQGIIDNIDTIKTDFWRDGYVIIPNIFNRDEVNIVKSAVLDCKEMNELHLNVQEKFKEGKHPSFDSIFVMNDVFGTDIFSKMTRQYKLLDTVSYFFDDDAYVYHNKIVLKYPQMPGFKYHQDYFYWYKMGCLLPNMATSFIALEKSTKENGCLKFLKGSHKLGRVEHTLFDGFSDSEVESERLNAAKERFEEVYIELEAGDVVLFHCNLFHASNDNFSENSRLSLLGCYNTKNNSPINRNWSHPPYGYQERFVEKISEADRYNLPDFSVSYQK